MTIDKFVSKRYKGKYHVLEQVNRQRTLVEQGAELVGWHSRRKRAKWRTEEGKVIVTYEIPDAPQYAPDAFEKGYQYGG